VADIDLWPISTLLVKLWPIWSSVWPISLWPIWFVADIDVILTRSDACDTSNTGVRTSKKQWVCSHGTGVVRGSEYGTESASGVSK